MRFADALAAGQIHETDGGERGGQVLMGHFHADLEDSVRPRRAEIDVVAGELPPALALVVASEGVVDVRHLGFDQVLDGGVFLLVVPNVEVAGRDIVAEEIDYVFVVDFEVTDPDFGHHGLLVDPSEYFADGEGDESEVDFDSLHGVGLPGGSLSVCEDAGWVGA